MNILFLTGHRRSGTTLLGSLLDDVDSLCVFPGDITLLYAYYPNYNNKNYSFKFKIKKIEKIMNTVLKEREQKTQANLHLKIFVKSFILKIKKENIDNIEKILKILVNSYVEFYKTKYDKKKIKYFVFKETSCSHLIFKLKKIFKELKVIHILRDPRGIYASLISGIGNYYKKETDLIMMESMIKRLNIEEQFMNINNKILKKNNYKVIKYEELVNNPKQVMTKISNFLSIKYDNKILQPTVLGKRSIGNNYNVNIELVSKKRKDSWKKNLKNKDIQIIEFFLKSFFHKFKYTKKISKTNLNDLLSYYNKINKIFFYFERF